MILPFTVGQLAQASGRTKEAAKKWKEGRSLPSAWSMLNMAQTIPAVRDWVISRVGNDSHPHSPQTISAVVEAVMMVANAPGPDGDAVRSILSRGGKKMAGG